MEPSISQASTVSPLSGDPRATPLGFRYSLRGGCWSHDGPAIKAVDHAIDLSALAYDPQQEPVPATQAEWPSSQVQPDSDESRLVAWLDQWLPDCSPAYGASPGHVFISYVREDSAMVDRLQTALVGAGLRVWRDTDDLLPGEPWPDRIRLAISDNALVFLACFSRAGLARRTSGQAAELTLAVEEMRRMLPGTPWLIPIRFDDCEVPAIDVGAGRTLASIQRLDLHGPADAWDRSLDRLVVAIRTIIGGRPPSARPIEAISRRGPSVPEISRALLDALGSSTIEQMSFASRDHVKLRLARYYNAYETGDLRALAARLRLDLEIDTPDGFSHIDAAGDLYN